MLWPPAAERGLVFRICLHRADGRRRIPTSTGEHEAKMLQYAAYGALARHTDKCDDGRGTEAVETLTVDVKSSYSSGQLPKSV